jgi:hypothetical protein
MIMRPALLIQGLVTAACMHSAPATKQAKNKFDAKIVSSTYLAPLDSELVELDPAAP